MLIVEDFRSFSSFAASFLNDGMWVDLSVDQVSMEHACGSAISDDIRRINGAMPDLMIIR